HDGQSVPRRLCLWPIPHAAARKQSVAPRSSLRLTAWHGSGSRAQGPAATEAPMRDMNAMRDEATRTRTARDVATAARDMADATRGGVARAAGYARTQAVRASERAGDL